MSKIPTAENFLHQSKSLHDMWDNTRGKGEWDEKAIFSRRVCPRPIGIEKSLYWPVTFVFVELHTVLHYFVELGA